MNTLVVCISKQQSELFDLFIDSSLVKRQVEKRRTHVFNYTKTTAANYSGKFTPMWIHVIANATPHHILGGSNPCIHKLVRLVVNTLWLFAFPNSDPSC
jgi:citrate lyase synthetase